ncbi:MAG: hypothetical protein M0T72_12355 [Candidatus Dormibacteraeota bacterium]|nr:hypothetical protein [Candidatus Dormibacteraeota bacterium]
MSSMPPFEERRVLPVLPSQMPYLRPPTPRANWRFTGLALGGLGLLALLRLVVSHPAPTPSHVSPQAAVAGYLKAAAASSQAGLESYLAPKERPGAAAMLSALRRDRVRMVSPSIGPTSVEGATAQVEVALEVCYRRTSQAPYTCELLSHDPLGLSSEIVCQELAGRWYVTTLLKPLPLAD